MNKIDYSIIEWTNKSVHAGINARKKEQVQSVLDRMLNVVIALNVLLLFIIAAL